MRLGTRLALATGVAVCLAVLLVSAVGFIVIRGQGLNAVDQALREDAEANIAGLKAGDIGEREFLEAPADGASAKAAPNASDLPPGVEVDVQRGAPPIPEESAGGAQSGAGESLPDDLPESGPIPETSIGGAPPEVEVGAEVDTPVGEPYTVEENGRTLRRLVLRVPDVDGSLQTYTFTRSIADTEAVIRVARYILLTVAALASLLAVAFILLLVRRAVRPLEAAQAAAEHVAESGDLSVRIPEGHPDEVGRLAGAMNIMLGRLEKARTRLRETVEEQRTFAADASHELRTPLTALRGDIELLLAHDLPAEERREVLQEMSRSSERMGSLVEGLLSLARLDAIPTREPQAVDVGGLIESLMLDDGSLILPEGAPPHALGDPEAIRSIFSNLLDNARKYGGETTATVSRDGSEVVAQIADDGPGIPPEDRERVFDRFHRAQAVRTRPGAGLGLAIARGAAEAMDGSLDLLPTTSGTAFEVRLPLGEDAVDRAREEPDRARS